MQRGERASVVVPTHRGREVLEACLVALLAQDAEDFEVIVVDDGSDDGTAQWVAGEFPLVRVVALPVNRGFCAAVNTGIAAARGRVIALLNDDTVPARDWLRHLVEALEADPTMGFAASRMLRHDDPSVLDGAGDGYSRHGLSFRVGRGERDDGRYGPRNVLWASGGASAYRREALLDAGGLDEGLHAYYEDVELGLRLRSAGWIGRYVPASSVRHIGGYSDAGRVRGTVLTTRNALLVLCKHWPLGLLLRHAPWLAYGQLRTAAWAARAGLGASWLRGIRSAVRAWPAARRASAPRRAPWAAELDRRYPFRPLIRRRR
jgi:hypothetical protein